MTAPHPGLPPVSESTGIILKMGPYPWGLAKEPALKTYPRRFLAIGTTSQWGATSFLHSLWFPAARPMFLLFPPSFLLCQLEPELRPEAGVTWPRANRQGSASAYFPIVQNIPGAAQTGTIQAMRGTFSWKTEERKGPCSSLLKRSR